MRESGQSLFEVVIALAISTIIIVALVSLVNNSIRNSTFSKNKTLAARHAQEAVEWLRSQRDSDINTFRTNSLTSIWCLKDLSFTVVGPCGEDDLIPNTIFKRQLEFTGLNDSGKVIIEASVKVTWEDAQGEHEVRNSTDFADWRQR